LVLAAIPEVAEVVLAAGGPRVSCRLAPAESTHDLHGWNRTMTAADAHIVKFQCPKCGHELEQTIGKLKLSAHMRCPGCGVGINIDTNRLANAAEEIQRAMDKVPAEITIKFFR